MLRFTGEGGGGYGLLPMLKRAKGRLGKNKG